MMMNNNVTGVVISGLLHIGLLGWISTANDKAVEISTPSSKVVLTVSMFQAEVIPSPTPVIKKAAIKPLAKITAPTPLNPEFADLPVTPKIVEKKVEKVASLKLATIKPPTKLAKPKTIKKPLQTRKPRKKIVKKKALIKKAKKRIKKRIVKKKIVRKVVKKQAKKVLVKIKPRQQRRISPPVKRSVTVAQQRKKAAAHLARKNDKRVKQQQAIRAKYNAAYKKAQAKRNTKKVAPQRQQVVSKPSKTATNTVLNASLGKQYKARLQQLIAANKRYPKRARRRGHQGRVTLSFSVSHSGAISNIRVIKGATNKDLNIASINAIRQASGKLRYPNGMSKKSLTLTVTLSYILS